MNITQMLKTSLSLIKRSALMLAVLGLVSQVAYADDGTWTNTATGGLWSSPGNWSGGIVATGNTATANFNTLDLAADNTVKLDAPYTLNRLIFGDINTGTAYGWILTNNATPANILTLDGTTPTIVVNSLGGSKTVAIGAVIAGSAGLTKDGAGTLTLNGSAVNTFTGGLTINGGTLTEDFSNFSTPVNLINSGNTLALGGGALTIKGHATVTPSSQTLGDVTVNAGGGSILGTAVASKTNLVSLGTITASATGGSLLLGAATTTGVNIFTTTSNKDDQGIYGGRVVWFTGTANTGYDWATTTSGSSPYTLSALTSYTTLPTSGGLPSVNYKMTAATSLGGNFSVNTLKLEAPSGDLALGANTLTVFGGGLLMSGTTGRNITGTATTGLTAGNGSGSYDLLVHQCNSGALTISAKIGDNGANAVNLVKCGPGQLTINTNNTYTGNTTINAGTVTHNIQLNSFLGTSNTKVVTIQSGASLILTRVTLTGSQLILNGGSLKDDNGYGSTWNGAVVLTADSFFTGYSANAGTVTINGGISGTGGFTRTSPSAAALVLNGTNTYTGVTIIGSSTVAFSSPYALYNATPANWTPANIIVASGATLQLKVGAANSFTDAALVGLLLTNLTSGINNNGLKGGSTVTFDTAGSTTFNLAATINNSTGAGGGIINLQKIETGTLTLSGANTYTGTTTLNGKNTSLVKVGVASVPGVSGALGNNSAVNFNADYNQLDLNGYDLQIGSLKGIGSNSKLILGAKTITIGGNNTSPGSFSGIISGAGGNLTKIGTGTLTLTGPNTYTGVSTLSNGVVNLGIVQNGTTSGPLGANGSIVLGGALLQYTTANQNDYSGRFSTAPGQIYKVDTTNRLVTWASSLTSSGGTLSKIGTGTLTLSGANTYNGATILSNGTLKAGVASVLGFSGAFGNNSAVTLANTNVVLDITGFNTSIGSLMGGGESGGIVTNSSATLTVGGDNTSPAAYAGDIAGSGNLVKIGTGILTLNKSVSYSGTTTISGGTLALGSNGLIPNTVSIDLAAGATFDVSAKSSPYTLGGSTSFSASGTNQTTGAATLKGPSGGTISLNAQPMTLTFTPSSFTGDTTHPALTVSQGNLDATGVVIALNNSGTSPLDIGTYMLIENVSGTISGTPTLSGVVGGAGIVGGTGAAIALSGDGKAVNLVVSGGAVATTTTITRHTGTSYTSTYGDTLLFDVTVSADNGAVTLRDGGEFGLAIGSGILSSGACTITATLNGLTAGIHSNIVAVYGGYTGYLGSTSDPLNPAQTVSPKTITVAGATGNNKLYDGTATATLIGTLSGVVTGDTELQVSLIGTGTFDNGGVPGSDLSITSTSTLGGTKALSYTLSQPTGITGSILTTAVWMTAASGLDWNTPGNWLNNLVGNGADVMVDFNQVNITGATSVDLDSPRTLGGLIFGDTVTGSAGSWTLGNNGSALNTLTLTGTAPAITANTGGNATILPDLTLSNNTTIAGSGQVDIAGVISGPGGLTKNGNGFLKIYGLTPNTYSGGTVVNGGTLHLGTMVNGVSPECNYTAGTGPVTLNNGATLEFDRVAATNALISNGGTVYSQNGWGASWSGPVILNSNTTVNATFNMTFSRSISGEGGISKTGTATLNLNATNTFTGTTTITAGTLQIGSAGQLASKQIVVTNTALLTLSNSSSLDVGTTVMIADGGAKIDIPNGVTQTITALYLGSDGKPKFIGTWGHSSSDALNKDDVHFTNTSGKLIVTQGTQRGMVITLH